MSELQVLLELQDGLRWFETFTWVMKNRKSFINELDSTPSLITYRSKTPAILSGQFVKRANHGAPPQRNNR